MRATRKLIERKFDERRKHVDPLVKWLNIIVVVSFAVMFLIIVVTTMPMTSGRIQFFRTYNLPPGSSWNQQLFSYTYYLLLFQFVISIAGIILNWMRSKRKSDRFHFSLIFFAVLSLAGIILFNLDK